jgi:hypothetical protein
MQTIPHINANEHHQVFPHKLARYTTDQSLTLCQQPSSFALWLGAVISQNTFYARTDEVYQYHTALAACLATASVRGPCQRRVQASVQDPWRGPVRT